MMLMRAEKCKEHSWGLITLTITSDIVLEIIQKKKIAY